jgi:hypothetical protein
MHNEILSGCQRFLPQLFGQRHPENFATGIETKLKLCVREFFIVKEAPSTVC